MIATKSEEPTCIEHKKQVETYTVHLCSRKTYQATPSDLRCATHCPCWWLGWTGTFDCRCSVSSLSSPSDSDLHLDNNKRRLPWTPRGISLEGNRNREIFSTIMDSDSYKFVWLKTCFHCKSDFLYLQHSAVLFMLVQWHARLGI